LTDRIVLVHVIDTLGLGGAERFVVDLCAALPPDRYQPIIVTVAADGPRADDARRAGIELLSLNARSHWDVRVLWRLSRFLRDRGADIIHTHLSVAGAYGRLAALLAGVPVRVTTGQNAYLQGYTLPRWQVLLNTLLAQVTDRHVAVSEGTRDYLELVENVAADRIRVVPNAIRWPGEVSDQQVETLKQELGIGDRRPLLGVVGRLVEQKGQLYALQALALLKEDHPELLCLFVGQGPQRQHLERLTEALGLSDRVIFTGPRTDIDILLRALDLFVLPSIYEGLPLSLLEAMAADLPVVATDVPGSREVIEDGLNGRLVKPADAVALAAAIAELLANPAAAQEMAARGQETVRQRYTIGPVARKYQQIYQEALRYRKPVEDEAFA